MRVKWHFGIAFGIGLSSWMIRTKRFLALRDANIFSKKDFYPFFRKGLDLSFTLSNQPYEDLYFFCLRTLLDMGPNVQASYQQNVY